MPDQPLSVENPQTWNPVEKTIYDAYVEFKNSGTVGLSLMRRVYNKLLERGFVADQSEEVLGFDHVAIAVEDIELWTSRYEERGARVIYNNSDVDPGGASSMHIRGLMWGGLRMALVSPIDRKEESQVRGTIRRHGDHAFQHIAIRVGNIKDFKDGMQILGTNFLGEIGVSRDAFGDIWQIFGQPFDKRLPPEEGMWWEFAQRPDAAESAEAEGACDFHDEAAEKLHKDVEDARKSGTRIQFIE